MLRLSKGFTLVELMVTVAIAAIVLGIAIPSFNSLMLNNRSVALGEDFAMALNFTRAEAVKRKERVSLCASDDGISCAATWTNGFMVFVDNAPANNSVAPVVPDALGVTTILRVWPAQDPDATITVTNNGAAATFIRYTSRGVLAQVANAEPFVINAQLDGCSGDSARRITVRLAGAVTVERVACP